MSQIFRNQSGKVFLHTFFIWILFVSLFGCNSQPADTGPLKIAVLPIIDAVPLYVAQEQGYFDKQGVKVEFIPVGSAAERDQVMAAGQADGMINDLVSTVLYNRDTTQIQIVRFMRVALADTAMYRIVAAKDSGITSAKDLAGVEIGISQGSVIAYVTDRLLEKQGFSLDQIKTIAVPKIPDRLSLLASGKLKAATLPEPFGTLAIQQGGVVVVDDTSDLEAGTSVISFRKPVIDGRNQSVAAFLKAVDQAIQDVNASPDKFESILDKYKLIPASLSGKYPIPKFPGPSVPTQAQFEDVVNWTMEKGLVSQKVDFGTSINAGFIK